VQLREDIINKQNTTDFNRQNTDEGTRHDFPATPTILNVSVDADEDGTAFTKVSKNQKWCDLSFKDE